LPYVGNDIVDLKEPGNTRKSRDLHFLKKILTDAEIEFVQSAENSDKALWSCWAYKETAYKIIKKSRGHAAFLPCQWSVIFKKSKSTYIDGEITAPSAPTVYLRLLSCAGYVHCVGTDCRDALEKIICNVVALPQQDKGEKPDASLFLRECLTQDLARYFHLKSSDININRIKENGELQPPYLFVSGKKSDIDISLSHDGQFVAYAFLSW
jgi:phosphopantetheinyl transferase